VVSTEARSAPHGRQRRRHQRIRHQRTKKRNKIENKTKRKKL
jgi:hypothetical protein